MCPLGVLPPPRLHPEAPGEARVWGQCRGPGQLHEGGCRRALCQGRGEEYAQSFRKVSAPFSRLSAASREGSLMARGLLRRPGFVEFLDLTWRFLRLGGGVAVELEKESLSHLTLWPCLDPPSPSRWGAAPLCRSWGSSSHAAASGSWGPSQGLSHPLF